MRGKGNIVIIIVVSVLLIAGMSFGAKSLGLGIYGDSTRGSYQDNVFKASTGDDKGVPSARGGCSTSRGGCSSAGGSVASSCCSGGGSAGLNVEQVKAGVLKYYAQQYGDTEVVSEVKDFGCHMEAAILKDGKVVKKFSISGGRITEIG